MRATPAPGPPASPRRRPTHRPLDGRGHPPPARARKESATAHDPPSRSRPDDPLSAAPSVDDALRFLRAERAGELAFEGHVRPLKFVTDNRTGHVVAPLMVAALESGEVVLHIPEEDEDALQLLCTPEPIDENDEAADRWRIYHGEPEDVRWARLHIETARWGPVVYDGEAFMVENPLAADEPRLCKKLNQDKDALKNLVAAAGHAEIADPLCVGADPDGLHIRARFGVNRVEFPRRADSAADVEKMIGEMGEEGSRE